MRLFNQSTLRSFWEEHPETRTHLQDWAAYIEAARWACMDDVARAPRFDPDPVGNDRIVFNILRNSFRLVCSVDFDRGWVFLQFFGTHRQYDRIDVRTVRYRKPRPR